MRILLPKGEQRKFIEKILSRISIADAAKLCNLSKRTIRDWRRERFLMDKKAVFKLCKKTNVLFPKKFKEKDDYWYVLEGSKLGGKIGAMACIKKYGCVGGPHRKEKWYEWWESKGKFVNSNPLFRRKAISKPRKSKELAEFIGIMLGDGGFTARAKQIQITLNSRDDKEYIKFVCNLINKLFNRKPSIFECKDAVASKISVSNMDLVDYLIELGLKTGNKIKLQMDIPDWIKNKKSYSIACVRGLVDTDGCVFNHKYLVKEKIYNYKKLAFASYSQPMRQSVYNILESLGIKSRLFSCRDVRIDSQKDMKTYFKLVGSHNSKHLNKYYK